MDYPPDLSLSSPISPYTPTTPPKKKRSKVVSLPSSVSNKPKPPSRKPDPSAPKITMPCSECGKKFWSWKALYGHMRCHPDRHWRGIHPPNNNQEMFAVTEEDQEAASCLLLLANSEMEAGHKCGICMKVFSSGQALGGHKRCHWDKNSTAGKEPELDLNIPPEEMEQRNELQLVLRLGI